MMREDHFDVAAYALGVLDERDAARFEEHLAECPTCALELESFLPVVDVLADIDAEAMAAVEQSHHEGVVLRTMIGEVAHERHRAGRRRLYALAAGVVLFMVLAVGALFAGGQWFGSGHTPVPSAQRSSSQIDQLPPNEGVDIGGTDLPGDRYQNTDPRTGVALAVGLEKKDWGTQVSFAVANVQGPLTCRLVAVRTDGSTEVLSTWTVPAGQGWGTGTSPAPLLLMAVTAIPRDDIAHLQVQSVDSAGATQTLVRAP